MPSLKEFLIGKKGKVKKAGTLSPEQEQLSKLITEGLANGTGPLADIFGFNEENFQKGVEQPALKNFQENILPQIQEKFIAGNQVLGSGMRRGQLKAATDLQSQLSQLRYGAQNQALQNKLTGINSLLGTRAVENIYAPSSQGIVQGFVKGAGQGLGQAAGAAVAG